MFSAIRRTNDSVNDILGRNLLKLNNPTIECIPVELNGSVLIKIIENDSGNVTLQPTAGRI